MVETQRNPGGWGTAFSVVLCVLVVVFFAGGSWQYVKGEFIDYQLHLLRRQDSILLVLLFSVPIVLQLSGLIALFLRLRRDKSLTIHYAFCIFTMSSCPLSYCLLWICYTKGWHSWVALSYVSLGAIVFLLLPVIVMTYAVMWTRPRRTTSDLEEGDILNLSAFCSELKNGGTTFVGYRTRILEALDNDLRGKLMRAENETDYQTISRSELARDLNRIIRSPDLHLTINSNNQTIGREARELLVRGQRNLTNAEVQRLHRLLLEASFPSSIQVSPIPPPLRKSMQHWEDFLVDIKEGITKAHFWVLANFFAVFLGVTFLFGFAFAFHDQDSIAKKVEPDLYMAKTFPSRTVAQQLQDHATASQPRAVPGYTFYFDSNSAHPEWVEHAEFNDKPYVPDEDDPRKNWKDGINYSRVERITDDILKLTAKGERLRVELVGSTDYCDLQAAPYSSNYELSEARAQNIKYLLIDKLLNKDLRQRDIEWLTVPVSSEASPLAVLPAGAIPIVDCDQKSGASRIAKRKTDPSTVSELITELENQKSTLVMLKQLSPSDVAHLQNKVDELEKIVRNNYLRRKAIIDPLGKIEFLTSATVVLREAELAKLSREKIEELTKDQKRKEVELQESLDAFKYVDENAGMRVVAVSLRPVQESRWFIPLSLMDYMYFSIYTITTTGYGDIVPTTTFAKFLCSAANILEVFFLVVFFNALLSVRGDNRFSRIADKK